MMLCSFVFFSVIDYSKEICNILLLIEGEMESRCLSKAAFVKDVDSLFTIFSGVRCHHHCHQDFALLTQQHW
jgi:hypothetical protein